MLVWYALIVIALAVFTSTSASGLFHILAGIEIVKSWKVQSWKKLPLSSILLLFLSLTMLVSMLVNYPIMVEGMKHITKIRYYLIAIAIIPLFRNFEWNEKKISLLLKLFLFATTLATVCGSIGLYTGYTPLKFKNACHPDRNCGLYGMYMTYGYGIGMFQVLALGFVLYREELKTYIESKWLWIVFAVNLFGLITSYARGAWIGFLVAIPFYFFKKHKLRFLQVFGLLALISLGALSFSSKVQDTFFNREGSNSQRLSQFYAAWEAFKDYPVLGVGFLNFEPLSSSIKKEKGIAYPEMSGHAHNNYLETMASTGILGIIFFLGWIGLWLRETYKRDDLVARLTFPVIVAFVVSGFTQYTFGDAENIYFILTLYALSMIKQEERHV